MYKDHTLDLSIFMRSLAPHCALSDYDLLDHGLFYPSHSCVNSISTII